MLNVFILNLTCRLILNVTLHKINEISTHNVGFYSVKLGSASETEFHKFYEKDFIQHEDEFNEIEYAIHEMGQREARSYYFKNEGGFEYLPFIGKEQIISNDRNDYGVRLYCKFLTPHLVILFNGDIKTNHNPEQCNNVKDHFRRAKLISKKIDDAFNQEFIMYKHTFIDFDPNFEIDI